MEVEVEVAEGRGSTLITGTLAETMAAAASGSAAPRLLKSASTCESWRLSIAGCRSRETRYVCELLQKVALASGRIACNGRQLQTRNRWLDLVRTGEGAVVARRNSNKSARRFAAGRLIKGSFVCRVRGPAVRRGEKERRRGCCLHAAQ